MQLGELSDAELVSGIKEKCRDEHRFVAEIVAYLAEVEKRDLHREMGGVNALSDPKRSGPEVRLPEIS